MANRITHVTMRRLARFGSVVVLGLLVASCGLGGDDDNPEPTITSESEIESQSTQAVEPTTAPSNPATPDSPFILIPSTPESEDDTPTAEAAVGTPPEENPTVDATEESLATPDTATRDTSDAATETPVSESDSDGTSGPAGASELLENPGASPAADPADSGDSSDADVATVESCDVVEAPPFTGDSADFVTSEEVNFRVGPGSECETLLDGPLTVGTAVTVLSDPVVRADDPDGIEWVQVDVDGEIGWLATEFIEPAE